VILFFDNDIGRGVPDALHSVDIRVLSVLRRYRRGNTPDTRWLRDAGQNGWLVISCNKDILNVDEERELIISERVGIVFLTSCQDKAREILKLVLAKWSWLERITGKWKCRLCSFWVSMGEPGGTILSARLPRRYEQEPHEWGGASVLQTSHSRFRSSHDTPRPAHRPTTPVTDPRRHQSTQNAPRAAWIG